MKLTTSVHLALRLTSRTVFYSLHMSSCHGQGLLHFSDLINFDLATHFISLLQLHLEDFCSDVHVQKLMSGYTCGCKRKKVLNPQIL